MATCPYCRWKQTCSDDYIIDLEKQKSVLRANRDAFKARYQELRDNKKLSKQKMPLIIRFGSYCVTDMKSKLIEDPAWALFVEIKKPLKVNEKDYIESVTFKLPKIFKHTEIVFTESPFYLMRVGDIDYR